MGILSIRSGQAVPILSQLEKRLSGLPVAPMGILRGVKGSPIPGAS